MSASLPPLQSLAPERKLSGTTRAFLAFATGTLFALLPMYYFYMGRDAVVRGAPGVSPALAPVETQAAPAAPASADTAARFAARMTYELSQAPAEPPPAPVKAAPQAAPALTADEMIARRSPPPASDVVASRVQHARPIIASPPEPRDTTREMEKEARRADYREPQVRQSPPESVQPRVIDGRDVALPARPSAVATRAISAGPAIVPKPETDADAGRRGGANGQASTAGGKAVEMPLATGAVIAGVTPIGRPPEVQTNREPAAKTIASAAAISGPVDSVEGRLAATREWLAAAAQTTHTIQIMGTNNEEQLKGHLKALSKLLEPGKIYAFRTLAQGKPAITVVYGAYADKQAALQALEKLPAAVGANKPVLRTVNGIRAEQKQHGIKTDS
ncbi:MAG: Sporulation domain protein [Betaproteobacteria bacterium]|nr:Sporulation domain protein [Betaproteobacteria bacterium]